MKNGKKKRYYLINLRRKAKLTQAKVAQMIGCKITTYCLWETGVTIMLTVGTMDDLAKAFGVSPFVVFGEELDWLNGCARGSEKDCE